MKFPLVTRKRHDFVVSLLSHYKKKAERLEAEKLHPRANDGKFRRNLVIKQTRIGTDIRQNNVGKRVEISNDVYNFLTRNGQ